MQNVIKQIAYFFVFSILPLCVYLCEILQLTLSSIYHSKNSRQRVLIWKEGLDRSQPSNSPSSLIKTLSSNMNWRIMTSVSMAKVIYVLHQKKQFFSFFFVDVIWVYRNGSMGDWNGLTDFRGGKGSFTLLLLTYFFPMFCFDAPWKLHKTWVNRKYLPPF